MLGNAAEGNVSPYRIMILCKEIGTGVAKYYCGWHIDSETRGEDIHMYRLKARAFL